MNNTQHAIMMAIRATINRQPFTAAIDDPRRFYMLAREGGVSGMMFEALSEATCERDILTRFKRDALLYQMHHEKQMVLIKNVSAAFNAHKIDHIYLKGVSLKAIYPEPYMRSMGDVDVLVKPETHERAIDALVEKGFSVTGRSRAHTNLKSPEGLLLEVHPELYSSIHTKHEPLFKNTWSHAIPTDTHRYVFNAEFELAYLVYHAIKHFYGTGVGLRSVLDIALYTVKKRDAFNDDALFSLMDQSALTQVFDNLLELGRRYFDLDAFPARADKHTVDAALFQRMTDYLFDSGVHGKAEGHNPFIGRVGAARLRDEGRLRFILRTLFMPYEDMRATRPWLKTRLLLPVAWLMRFVSLLFKRTRRTLRKTRQLLFKKEKADELETMLRDFGL